MASSLKSKSRSRAINHEGTKGDEGKVKTFISNQQTQSLYIYCLGFLRALCAALRLRGCFCFCGYIYVASFSRSNSNCHKAS